MRAAFALGSLLLALHVRAQSPDLNDFQLVPSEYNAREFAARVAALEKVLPSVDVRHVLAHVNRPATFGEDCRSPAFHGITPPAQRYCFDAEDTSAPGDRKLEWMPQGVTTVADARADQALSGRQAILISWYDKQNSVHKGVRVSFLDTASKRYRHVLLVYPFIGQAGEPTYEILSSPQSGEHPGIHAGGIAWYENYLYVVDTTRGIRVFDMRRIFDLEAAGERADLDASDEVGLRAGKYRSFGYRYVMPQIAAWENPGGLASFPANFECSEGGTPRWPLERASGLPRTGGSGTWRAERAFRLPVQHVQGAVSYENRWYLSRTGGGPNGNATLVMASESETQPGVLEVREQRKAAIGTEDLSYWPGRDELWTVTEHPGKRALYGVGAEVRSRSW
jgi:hypothetical protein